MRHLDDEQIAGLIDGTITKKERETFLKHLSGCEECLTVYSETLKFMEEEKGEKVPFGETLKMTFRRFWDSMNTLVPEAVWIRTAAAVVIALVLGIFLLVNPPGDDIRDARVRFIADSVKQMDALYTFSPANDKTNAAVRTGFLIEDRLTLTTSGNNEKLKRNIDKRLQTELKTLFGSDIIPPAELEIEKRLREQSPYAPYDLYSLGRFIERSALDTFENKSPGQKEMDKYLKIAQDHDLPPGFFKRFRRVSTIESWKEIKEIFLVVK